MCLESWCSNCNLRSLLDFDDSPFIQNTLLYSLDFFPRFLLHCFFTVDTNTNVQENYCKHNLVPPPVTLGQLHCARAPQVGGCSAPIPRRHDTLSPSEQSHFKLNTCSFDSYKNEASSFPLPGPCGPHHPSVLYSSPLHCTWSLNLLVAETRAGLLRLLKGIPLGVH